MFFVFGPSGQMYRGGPENLARISAVRSVQRPQALRTRAMDAQDGQPVPVFTAPPRPTNADHTGASVVRFFACHHSPPTDRWSG